ncbi:hypothetical protein LOZ53_004337 [Ophidiomyces ophidiicola]|nr:hypothetical protein LOZ55_002448 [Ophidiomyces ophidiicola]KAI1987468.1 hypothetical protein LOZ53_004337 [Ophidiomyces ophidiicola]KAI1988081.1 hypothetical protein LOZ51_005562 [Ophidiomyces ophidiicola]KAI1988351.1 hypothetical protein LOZ54_003246 [Ophidiomyces ophidiicola]
MKIFVTIHDEGMGFFKHWNLFVDGEEPIAFQALGSDKNFRFDARNLDTRNSRSVVEVLLICDVDASKYDAIKTTAENIPIRNDIPVWNCQDYVLDLLRKLVEEGIIMEDDEYREKYRQLCSKLDGLV